MAKHIHDQAILYYTVNLADKITFKDFCDNAYDKSRPPGDNRLFFGTHGSKERRHAQTRQRDLNPKRFVESFDFEVSSPLIVDIILLRDLHPIDCCIEIHSLKHKHRRQDVFGGK